MMSDDSDNWYTQLKLNFVYNDILYTRSLNIFVNYNWRMTHQFADAKDFTRKQNVQETYTVSRVPGVIQDPHFNNTVIFV